ncbi:MAG: hypothetical protein ACK41Z_08970 [Sediminibacterium sp.]
MNWSSLKVDSYKENQLLITMQLYINTEKLALSFFYNLKVNKIDSGIIVSVYKIKETQNLTTTEIIKNYQLKRVLNFTGTISYYSITRKFLVEIGLKNGEDVFTKKNFNKTKFNSGNIKAASLNQCYDTYRVTYYSDGSENWEYLYSWCTGPSDCNKTTEINLNSGTQTIKANCVGNGGGTPYIDPLEAIIIHKFPINSNYEVLYPKFYRLIKTLYSRALKNSKVLDGLKSYGHFADNQKLFEILQFGRGAEIIVKNLNPPNYQGPHRYAHFDPKNPSIIEFNLDDILDMERSIENIKEEAYALFIFIVTMHETVHYANTLNGFFEKTFDYGFGWETYVYGQHIGSPGEAWEFILKQSQ